MKTNKRSLIVAIAVLCVCALSLTAASFAWFTSSTNANVSTLNLTVQSQSDLKVAIDSSATEVNNIEDSTLWKTSFTGTEIATAQSSTYTESAIADATYDEGFKKPADEAAIALDGTYDGDLTAATATQDYVQFTVYFRSTEANKTVVFTAPAGFTINGGKQGLKEALTLLVNEEDTYTTTNIANGGVVCECTTKVGDYYVGSATFAVYVDGENAAAINQNAGVTFALNQLAFAYQA